MRQKLIINDLHLGVQRNAGTTPKTALALKAYLLAKTRELMFDHLDKDMIINGDLFDAFNVPLNDVYDFFLVCKEWLEASEGTLTLAEGNHDLSKNSVNMPSIAFLAGALNSDRVILVETTYHDTEANIYIIPHVANQDMFDMELEKAMALSGTLILVHANYHNGYTLSSDHSLNCSDIQAKALVANDNTLLFGHVHQQAKPMKNVIVAGNQFPSSVADCLGNSTKQAFIFDPSSRNVNSITTWTASESFAQIDWDQLKFSQDYDFVRVTGRCPTAQASEMLAEISQYRQRSAGFVVTNAVSVDGVADLCDLPSSLEDAKGFDVLSFLFENLDEEQIKVIKNLMSGIQMV